jgi:hypothetical protein
VDIPCLAVEKLCFFFRNRQIYKDTVVDLFVRCMEFCRKFSVDKMINDMIQRVKNYGGHKLFDVTTAISLSFFGNCLK